MKLAKVFQPRHFDAFRCIGADCEDTCCVGWIVHVDKSTYEKYQTCSDPVCGSSLRTLITINEKSANDEDYAKIAINKSGCPFLSEGLCSIQLRLGEAYLPQMCATYPRVMNKVGDVLQRSLDLSCPEAARVALLDPRPMEFVEGDYQDGPIRLGNLSALDTSSLDGSPEPFLFFREVRRLAISLLQDRSQPVWRRLFMLGRFCEKLDEPRTQGDRNALRSVLSSIGNGSIGGRSACCPPHSTLQLEVVLELVLARIRSDFNPRSFLDCYRQFMDGIQWTMESTMDEIGARYAEAYARHYVSVMSQHEHMLEHYLVNYAHRTLFPIGMPESNRRLFNDRVPSIMAAQYMLMAAYFAITQTLLIGMAGFYKEAFGASHIIKLVQSCTKAFEHSMTYPGQVIQMLAEKNMTTSASLCVLIRQ